MNPGPSSLCHNFGSGFDFSKWPLEGANSEWASRTNITASGFTYEYPPRVKKKQN